MRPTYIYGLRDPRDQKIHYIGKSNNPNARLKQHLDDNGVNELKEDWLADLRSCGLVPEVVILEETTMQDWQAREKAWIEIGIASDWPLTNISAGGNGMSEMLRDYWPDIMRDFLPPDLLKRYKTIGEAEQKEIARQTAIAVREYAGHRIDGNRGGQFVIASSVARSLIGALN